MLIDMFRYIYIKYIYVDIYKLVYVCTNYKIILALIINER
jgi:hypothetical protein